MSLYLIIMGVQGAGKGTQAAYISEKYQIPHVSTGDLFRAMKTREDELAKRVQEIMNSGQLVSDEVTNEVLRDRLEQADAANGVILDGYPRNIAQAEWLESYLAGRGAKLNAVLLLELDLYTAFKRAYGRVQTQDKKQTFNMYFHDDVDFTFEPDENGTFAPGVRATLKSTGEDLIRRADDEAGSVVKRIDVYVETTKPLVEHYRGKGVLVEIDASQPIERVSEAITTELDKVNG